MSDPIEICMAYLTCSNREEASRIARALVEESLAACVNILGEATSIYRWEEALCEETEVVLVAKTTRARASALIERAVALHSYDTPCVSILPVMDGHPAYQAWLREAVGPGN